MNPPFTEEQFLEVFSAYNAGVWPAQAALASAGVAAAFLAWRGGIRGEVRLARFALSLTGLLWLWAGAIYFKRYFAALTAAGEIFGSVFIAQGALLLLAVWLNGEGARPVPRGSLIAGAALVVYALVLYPAIGRAAGQLYPAAPTFGAPCPLTIFTFGIFCLLPAYASRYLLAIPLLWALIGSYAAFRFGVVQDFALLAAAGVAFTATHRAGHPLPLPRMRVRRA